MKKKSLFLVLASMFMLSGCGVDVEEVAVEEIVTNPTSLIFTVGDESKEVNYNVFGKGKFSKEVNISSLDESIAIVETNDEKRSFKVTPVGEGETSVQVISKENTAVYASVSVSVAAKVIKPEVTSIEVSKDAARIHLNDEPVSFTASVNGVGDFDKTITLFSENADVATVDKEEINSGESFLISPVSVGTAVIEVASKSNPEKMAKITFYVDEEYIEPTYDVITLSNISKKMIVSEVFDLAVVETSSDVTWSVEQEDEIVTLSNQSNTGVKITAVDYGKAVVKATVGETYATCTVTVGESETFVSYGIKVGDNEIVSLTKNTSATGDFVEQYTYTFTSLAAGTRIDFYGSKGKTNELINKNIGPSGDDISNKIQNNLKPLTPSGVDFATLAEISETQTLYFEIYEEGYSFWLTGGPEIEVPKPYLLGLNGDWTKGLKLEINTENEKEFYIKNVNLNVTDSFKFKYETTWFGYDNVKADCKALVNSGDEGNISVKENGSYSFYVNIEEGIWIEKEPFVNPNYDSYSMIINGNSASPITLVNKEVEPVTGGMLAQYTYTFESLTAGDTIDFYGTKTSQDSVKLTSFITSSLDDETVKNNLKPATTGGTNFTVQKSGTDLKIYFEIYDGVGFRMWLTGGEEILKGYYLSVNGSKLIKMNPDGTDPHGNPQVSVTNVYLASGSIVKLYNADTDTYFSAKNIDEASVKAFNVEKDGSLTFTKAGKYAFYLKLIFENDTLYVGEFLDTVSFEKDEIEVNEGTPVLAKATGTDEITYSITSGNEYIEIQKTDEGVLITFVCEGEAEVTAMCGEAKDTLKVIAKEEATPEVTVRFTVGFNTYASGDLYLMSSETGWTKSASSKMTWSENNIWYKDITLPIGTKFEFKFYTDYNSMEWEFGGDNRSYTFTKSETVDCTWGSK